MTYRNKTPLQELTSEKNRAFFHCALIFLFALAFLGVTFVGLVYGKFQYRDTGIVSPEKHPEFYWGSLGIMFIAGIFLIRQGAFQLHCFLSISNALKVLKEYEAQPATKSNFKSMPNNCNNKKRKVDRR